MIGRLVLALALLSGMAHAQGRTGGAAPDQEALAAAEAAFAEDRFDAAAEKFRQAIELNPRLTTAYVKLGTIYYRRKEYAKAVALLRQSPDQTDVELREQLGLSLYKTRTPPVPEAVAILDEVVAKKPEAYAAQGQRGLYYFKLDPAKAAAAFAAYLAHRPAHATENDQAMHEKLGFAYLFAKDWRAAEKEYEAQLKARPNDLGARLGLGAAYTGEGECTKAIALYERILNQALEQPSIYYNLGSCYLQAGRAADAGREAALYARARPADLKGHLLLGDAYFEEKLFDQALGAFLSAERLDAAGVRAKTRLGRTYLAKKSYPAALAVLETAAKAAPRQHEVLYLLAEAYAATGQPKEKLLALATRLAALTTDARAQYAAGVAFGAAGNEDAAQTAYRAAVARASGSGGANGGGVEGARATAEAGHAAREALARLFNVKALRALERDDPEPALAALDEAVALAPDDAATSRNRAVALLANRKFAEAAAALALELRKTPDDVALNRLLGRAFVGQAQLDLAIRAYETAVKAALRARGADLAGVYTELGPLYLEDPARLDQAVSVLEQAVKDAGTGPLAPVAQRNLAIAYFRRGSARLRVAKDLEGALDDIVRASQAPRGALSVREQAAVACGEAFAALRANKIAQAESAFERAGGACQLRPPYDRFGVALFSAYAAYRGGADPSRREAACRTFQSLAAKASGLPGDWVRKLQRSCWETLAYEYFQRSDEKHAEQCLKTARRLAGKSEARELDHNQGVLDMMLGRGAKAEKVFEALAGRPAESLVNLGILRDRAGDTKRALELYRRALEKGARAPKLREWIDVKERLFEARS